MTINIQDKKINIESWEDFELAMEKMLYLYKINQWISNIEKNEVFSEEEVFSRYNV